MVNGFRAFSNPSSFCLKDVKVLETDKKVAPKMDGATLSFSRTVLMGVLDLSYLEYKNTKKFCYHNSLVP